MRVGLYLADLRRSKADSQGIINYALGLVSILDEHLLAGEHIVVFAGDEIYPEIVSMETPQLQIVRVKTPRNILLRLTMDHIKANAWAYQHRLDILHFPKGFIPITRIGIAKTIATVHDDIAIRYSRKEFGGQTRTLKSRYFSVATMHSLRRANHVLTDSQYSATSLGAHVPPVRNRLSVVPIPIVLPLLRPKRQSVKPRTLLHLGSPHRHKRSREALTWARRFIDAHDGFRLTVIGSLVPEVEALCAHHGIDRVPGILSNATVAGMLRDSAVLLFPSVMEGFGLPPVEAWLMGTPSVWASAGALPEVMLNAPGRFMPDNEASFQTALDDVMCLDDDSIARQRAVFCDRFSRDRVAHQTLTAYRDVLRS